MAPEPDRSRAERAPDAICEGGDLDCGSGLLLIIREAMAPLPPRGLLEVRSRESSVKEDLPAWCRLVGHELVEAVAREGGSTAYRIVKGGAADRATSAEAPLAADLEQARRFTWSARVRWTAGMQATSYVRNHAVAVGQPASCDTADPAPSAIELLLYCRGRVVVTGMGKSGIICQKIAATLTSTGTPALFLHPAEALHGDLGIIQSDDVVIALSYSGETVETLRLLEAIRRLGAKLIAITGAPRSTLAEAADVALDCSVTEEACPMNLAPTASTTAALAIGDALAMTLLTAKGFKEQDFANLHPGGKLGKRLMRVESFMQSGEDCPVVDVHTPMREVIDEMTRKTLGMTCVVDDHGVLLGVITDGDLRRLTGRAVTLLDLTADDVMTRDPVTIPPHMLAAEALNLMEQRKITSLVIVDESRRVVGVVHLHGLWRTEMV